MSPGSSPSLLILGGGVAGLGAAQEACRLGARVMVVEQEDRVGGLLKTDRLQGFSFDRGGHRIITAIPWVLDRMRELLGDRLLLRERTSKVLLDGVPVEYPLRLGDLLRRTEPSTHVRAVGSYLVARLRRRRPERTLEDWLRSRFGNYLYRRVFAGYSAKLWGLPASKLSAEWAPQRFTIPSLGGFLRELVRPSAEAPRTYARRYLYPRLGIGEVAESLAREVNGRGGRIETRSRVQRLTRGRNWRATIAGSEGESASRFDAVVSTIPLGSLKQVLQLSEATPCLEQPTTRGLRFLNMGFKSPVPVDVTWMYQPDGSVPFTRVQIPAARSPEMVPQGCGSLQLEIPDNGQVLRRAELLDQARDAMRPSGFALPEPDLVFETREQDAYPVYRPEARQAASEFLEIVDRLEGLESAGRQGRFSYVFLDRAYSEGVNAARRVLGYMTYPVETGVPGPPLPLEAHSLLEAARNLDTDAPCDVLLPS